jgi:hypothetical protein
MQTHSNLQEILTIKSGPALFGSKLVMKSAAKHPVMCCGKPVQSGS